MTPAQNALAKKKRFDLKVSIFGQTITRTRVGHLFDVTTNDSIAHYKCITETTRPQFPTEYMDSGGANIGTDDSHRILYFSTFADIREDDILTMNGYEWNVTLAFPFVLSDVSIYKEIKVSRRKKQ